MKNILLLQLICVLHLASLSQQQIQVSRNECTASSGACTSILECPPYRNNFNAIFNRIKYCDLATSTVCCPVKLVSRFSGPTVNPNTLKFHERECIAYNDRVYPKCNPEAFIVGGTRAEPRQFPHMALLGAAQEDNKTIVWMCGGSLISLNYVLSAAHCFYDDPIPDRVRLGELDYSTDSDRTQTQDFVIKNYITHPSYNFLKNYNDIVLVELDRDAMLNQYVVPACLPSSNGTNYMYFTAAGWGATKTAGEGSTYLQKVRLERFDDQECQELVDLPIRLDQGLHIRSQLCAGSRVNSSDTCTGDSGGPLFVQHKKLDCMFQVVGITSFGQGSCGIKNIPAVYVRVSIYVGWIESIVWNLPSNECTASSGACKSILECPPYKNNFNAVFDSIKYCDLATSTVCCPVKILSRLGGPTVNPNTLKFHERECIAYNDRVYPKCNAEAFIVGGTRAEPREFPHMALLGAAQEDNKTIMWLCGGSLISRNYVLSAAHCFWDDPIPNRVRLGELDYSTDSDRTQTQDFVIKNPITHPSYNPQKYYNDIALVELDRDAELNQYVVPACLPSSNGTNYMYFIAAGWGATKQSGNGSTYLQKVRLERFDDKECQELVDLPIHLDQGLHIRSQLCAGSHVNSSDTCSGDSGGPLFEQHEKLNCMFQVVGITSFGQGSCGIKDIPAVYVRVSIYVGWIESIVWNLPSK